MNTVIGALYSLAVVAVAGAGFATIAGLASLRERLFVGAVTCVVAALGLPIVFRILSAAFERLSGDSGVSEAGAGVWLLPFLLGHAVLGGVLLKRRLGRRGDDELEAARGRARPRFLADDNEEEP